MKLKLIGTALAGIALIAAAATRVGASADQPPLSGSVAQFIAEVKPLPVPAVSFGGDHDDTTELGAFHGKFALVNLWATWCAPCVKELPSLDALQSARGGDRFQVVTISEDRQGHQAVDPFLDKAGIKNLPRFTDPKSEVGRAWKIRGLPTTLLIGPDGTELGRLEGDANWSSPEALALIDWYLAHPQASSER